MNQLTRQFDHCLRNVKARLIPQIRTLRRATHRVDRIIVELPKLLRRHGVLTREAALGEGIGAASDGNHVPAMPLHESPGRFSNVVVVVMTANLRGKQPIDMVHFDG